jgi:hypothetical protein
MKKVILIYGSIAGVIVGGMLMGTMPLYNNGTLNHDHGLLIGYTSMVIALSLVFFGVKSYRDKYLGGRITFWQAVLTGLSISLVASIIYGIAWEICYHTIAAGYSDQMVVSYVDNLKKSGASAAEIEAGRVKMEEFKTMYENPIVRFGFTLMEILPVGLVITVLSAALLKKKDFLPAEVD